MGKQLSKCRYCGTAKFPSEVCSCAHYASTRRCLECGSPPERGHAFSCSAVAENLNKLGQTGCERCGCTGGGHYTHCPEWMKMYERATGGTNPQIETPDPPPAGMVGWTCPRCARGNSPFTSTCPCIPMEYKVT